MKTALPSKSNRLTIKKEERKKPEQRPAIGNFCARLDGADGLLAYVGTSRDTYNTHRTHLRAPRRVRVRGVDGYDGDAWREFLKSIGVTTDLDRRAAADHGSIKREISEADLEMRLIEIDKIKGRLISRTEHEDTVIRICSIVTNSRENLAQRLRVLLGGTSAGIEAEKAIADEQSALRAEADAYLAKIPTTGTLAL